MALASPLEESCSANLESVSFVFFVGVIVGTVLTAIIQSSSASVGILQAFCLTGTVSYASALPIIMGQNIGTCVTALLSAVGARKNAKRAAFVHFYFNLIGTVATSPMTDLSLKRRQTY